jgi:hypothetical protein
MFIPVTDVDPLRFDVSADTYTTDARLGVNCFYLAALKFCVQGQPHSQYVAFFEEPGYNFLQVRNISCSLEEVCHVFDSRVTALFFCFDALYALCEDGQLFSLSAISNFRDKTPCAPCPLSTQIMFRFANNDEEICILFGVETSPRFHVYNRFLDRWRSFDPRPIDHITSLTYVRDRLFCTAEQVRGDDQVHYNAYQTAVRLVEYVGDETWVEHCVWRSTRTLFGFVVSVSDQFSPHFEAPNVAATASDPPPCDAGHVTNYVFNPCRFVAEDDHDSDANWSTPRPPPNTLIFISRDRSTLWHIDPVTFASKVTGTSTSLRGYSFDVVHVLPNTNKKGKAEVHLQASTGPHTRLTLTRLDSHTAKCTVTSTQDGPWRGLVFNLREHDFVATLQMTGGFSTMTIERTTSSPPASAVYKFVELPEKLLFCEGNGTGSGTLYVLCNMGATFRVRISSMDPLDMLDPCLAVCGTCPIEVGNCVATSSPRGLCAVYSENQIAVFNPINERWTSCHLASSFNASLQIRFFVDSLVFVGSKLFALMRDPAGDTCTLFQVQGWEREPEHAQAVHFVPWTWTPCATKSNFRAAVGFAVDTQLLGLQQASDLVLEEVD